MRLRVDSGARTGSFTGERGDEVRVPCERVFFKEILMRLKALLTAPLVLCFLATTTVPRAWAQEAPPTPDKAPARRARSSTRTLSATFLALDSEVNKVRLALEGGTSATALLNTESRYQKNGKAARVSDFAAGEKLTARLQFKPGGEIWLRNLWDAASYAAYTKERREVCAGVVARNTGKLLRVQRADGSTLDLRVTDTTSTKIC